MYVSLHQRGIYPGTGLSSDDNYVNYPLDVGTGPDEYLTIFKQALEEVKKFKHNLLAISIGFDTYKNDPLTGLALEIETYKKIGQMIAGLGMPLFAVLEGGYNHNILGKNVKALILGLE